MTLKSKRTFLLLLTLVGIAILIAGCGGGGDMGGAGPLAIRRIEAPEQIGIGGVAQFVATVTGARDARIQWTMENPNWTATSTSGESVTWTAPGNIGKYTITVTASAPGQRDVVEQVEIEVVDGLVVNIEPLPQPVVVGQQVTLKASVSGHGSENATVRWAANQGRWRADEGTQVSWEAPQSVTDGVTITVTATTPAYPQGVTDDVTFNVDVCSGGDITDRHNPCEIGSYYQFRAIQANREGHYRLIADIDLSEGDGDFPSFWTFKGTLSGGTVENPHTIRNLSLGRTGHVGRFAAGMFNEIDVGGGVYNLILDNVSVNYVGVTSTIDGLGALAGVNKGTVEGVTIRNASITTVGDRTGALVGTNEGTIRRSAVVDSDVEGQDHAETIGGVGGLVGYNNEGAIIETSFAFNTNVEGKLAVGGLVGTTHGTVRESYSLGLNSQVTATERQAGGLIGYFGQHAVIDRNYSAIAVTSPGLMGGLTGHGYLPDNVTDSFWDMDVSGTAEARRGGTGRSSGQMKGSAWYPGSWKSGGTSWVFVNGEYPHLRGNSRP